MHIKRILVKNFRGINVEINDLRKDFLIMGRNDTGKSNLCYSIRKLLDFEIRKNPLCIEDSSNSNGEDIFIQIEFDVNTISIANRTKIAHYIDRKDEYETFTVTFEAKFSKITQFYDEIIYFGTIDKSKEYGTNRPNDLDKVLNLIYINPNYNIEREKSRFFKYIQLKRIDENEALSEDIKQSVASLNEMISKDENIDAIKRDINSQIGFDSIFEEITFAMTSNINISNIYKSLEIIPKINDEKDLNNIGDGKSKTLSMLLQKMSYDEDKQRIFILEEPENHLYPLLQKHYASLVNTLGMDQVIYTTHSPYIVDFRKMDQIIKLISIANENGDKQIVHKTINVSSEDYKIFGYLMNEEIAEMLFYDKVLLVEGLSEKYFYNALTIMDSSFREFLAKNKMGIFNIMGVDFSPAKILLEKLGIVVFIKTDNDIFKVPKKNLKRYAGYDRGLSCLNENSLIQLKTLLNVDSITKDLFRFEFDMENNPEIEKYGPELQKIFSESGIYISLGHEGFEEDFLHFIGEQSMDANDLDYLKKAKLKNLHVYVQENNVSLGINDKNKDSILVRFMDHEY